MKHPRVDLSGSRRDCLKGIAGLAFLGASCKGAGGTWPGLWLAGDLHLGDRLAAPSPLLKALPGAGIVNLEGPIARGPAWQKGSEDRSVVLRNSTNTPSWLNAHGVQAVSLLNNHSDDLGAQVKQDTRARLGAAKLKLVHPASQALLPLAQSWYVASVYLGSQSRKGVSKRDLDEISKAQSRGQLIALSVHLDAPPSFLPSPPVRAQLLALAEAGARVIAVHGSHVIGPVERRGQSIIAWGLGNLSFACPCSTEREGLILQVQADASKTIQATILPILTGNAKAPVRQHPDPASIFELLEALESSPLRRQGHKAKV